MLTPGVVPVGSYPQGTMCCVVALLCCVVALLCCAALRCCAVLHCVAVRCCTVALLCCAALLCFCPAPSSSYNPTVTTEGIPSRDRGCLSHRSKTGHWPTTRIQSVAQDRVTVTFSGGRSTQHRLTVEKPPDKPLSGFGGMGPNLCLTPG